MITMAIVSERFPASSKPADEEGARAIDSPLYSGGQRVRKWLSTERKSVKLVGCCASRNDGDR